MDTLTFISEIAKALAWPVVVGVGLKIVGAELVTLLREITDLKIGNVELKRKLREVSASVNIAEAEAATATATAAANSVQPSVTELPKDAAAPLDERASMLMPPEPNHLLALGAPEAAVEMSWKRLEQALRLHGITAQEPYETRSERLSGLTGPATVQAIENLREVRNAIMNSRTGINGQEAINYTIATEKVVQLLMNTPSWRQGKT